MKEIAEKPSNYFHSPKEEEEALHKARPTLSYKKCALAASAELGGNDMIAERNSISIVALWIHLRVGGCNTTAYKSIRSLT